MMGVMVGISTRLYDLNGDLYLEADSTGLDHRTVTRRVSRTATLDGGSSFIDQGYSASDETKTFKFKAAKDIVERLEYLVKNHAELTVSTEQGCFLAAPQTCRYQIGTVTLILLVKSTL